MVDMVPKKSVSGDFAAIKIEPGVFHLSWISRGGVKSQGLVVAGVGGGKRGHKWGVSSVLAGKTPTQLDFGF